MNLDPVSPRLNALPGASRPESGTAEQFKKLRRSETIVSFQAEPPAGEVQRDDLAQLTREELESRVADQDARLQVLNEGLSFRVHEGSGQLMVQVVDRNTGEIVREMPPSEFLDLAVRLQEMVGAFLDEKS